MKSNKKINLRKRLVMNWLWFLLLVAILICFDLRLARWVDLI